MWGLGPTKLALYASRPRKLGPVGSFFPTMTTSAADAAPEIQAPYIPPRSESVSALPVAPTTGRAWCRGLRHEPAGGSWRACAGRGGSNLAGALTAASKLMGHRAAPQVFGILWAAFGAVRAVLGLGALFV